MTARDAYEYINEQDEATVRSFVNRLEFRAKAPTFCRFRDDYLDRMQLASAATVLDLGRRAMEDGVFFAACNFYAHLARR